MSFYKISANLHWEVDSSDKFALVLQQANDDLNKLLKSSVKNNLSNLSINLTLNEAKSPIHLKHLKEYKIEKVLKHVDSSTKKTIFTVNKKKYAVKLFLPRYHLLLKHRECCACGLVGTKMYLDVDLNGKCPRFNLYGMENNGKLIPMTIDHHIPKSKKGSNHLDNLRLMCQTCNQIRGDLDLTLKQIKELKEIYLNPKELTKKQLKVIIQEKKKEFVKLNKKKVVKKKKVHEIEYHI